MENNFKEEKEIISEYWEADLNDKIVLFLQYRELRPDFTVIDQAKKRGFSFRAGKGNDEISPLGFYRTLHER